MEPHGTARYNFLDGSHHGELLFTASSRATGPGFGTGSSPCCKKLQEHFSFHDYVTISCKGTSSSSSGVLLSPLSGRTTEARIARSLQRGWVVR